MYHVMEGVMVPAALGIDTLDALRAKAVAEPGKLNYGTLGERTTTDAFRQWLGEHWNTKFVAIPYKGGSEIISALLGNDIEMTKIGVGNMVSQLKEGKIKMLALNAAQALAQLPNVPTFNETGLRRLPRRPDLLGRRGADRHAGADRGEAARRIAGDLPEPEIPRLRPDRTILDPAAGSTGDFRRLPQKGPPGRQGGGRYVYEVTARRTGASFRIAATAASPDRHHSPRGARSDFTHRDYGFRAPRRCGLRPGMTAQAS